MKREIKFRAWDKIDKRMIVDKQDFITLIVTSAGVFRMSATHESYLYSLMPIDRFDLMQVTGLLDKNGKEIYEGDILRVDYLFEYITIEVYFTDSAWCIKGKKTDDWISKWLPEELEVIGNIYENKDLLNV